MTNKSKVYLLLLIVLVLLNISLSVLIRDAKYLNLRNEFIEESNLRVGLSNQYTELLTSEVDDQKLGEIYSLLSNMESIRVENSDYLLQGYYSDQVDLGWEVADKLEKGEEVDVASYNAQLQIWNKKIEQQKMYMKIK